MLFWKHIKPEITWRWLFPRRLREIEGYIKFTKESRYSYPDKSDQKDYRKLLGLKRYFISAHRLSAMLAYSYDDINKNYRVTPYFHLDLVPDRRQYINVGKFDGYVLKEPLIFEEEKPIYYKIVPGFDCFHFIIDDNVYTVYFRERKLKKWWRINGWFGGTLAPNSKVKVIHINI